MFDKSFDFQYRLQLFNLMTEADLKKLNSKMIDLTFFERTMNAQGLFHFSFYLYDTNVHFYIHEKNYHLSMQILVASQSSRVQDTAINIGNKVKALLIKRMAKIPQLMFLPQSRDIDLSLILR